MTRSSIRDPSWYVQVPLNDLLSLQNTVYELMGAFNDYKKGVPVRRGA